MKNLLIIGLLTFCLTGYGQSNECSNFRTGEFRMEDPSTGINFISRTELFQIEHLPKLEVKVQLNVNWIDSCTLKLTLNKVLLNPKKMLIEDFVLVSEIIKTTDSSYTMRSKIQDSDIELIREFIKVR